jgi:hypothetical protein
MKKKKHKQDIFSAKKEDWQIKISQGYIIFVAQTIHGMS